MNRFEATSIECRRKQGPERGFCWLCGKWENVKVALGGVLICQTCDSRRIERRPGPVVGEIVRRETAALLRLV
jgi:hypothetical protein